MKITNVICIECLKRFKLYNVSPNYFGYVYICSKCSQRMKEEKKTNEKKSYEQQRVEDEEYFRKMNAEIDKNKERNNRFLSDNGYMSDYIVLLKHIEEKPKEFWRKDVGDEYFEASLTLSSCYNSLIMGEFWRQSIDEVKIKWIFEQISKSLKSVGKKK